MQKNPPTNIKLFLFDLDGTLIDTAPDFLTSLNNVLAENNRDLVHLDDIRQFISDGSGKLVEVGFGIDSGHEQFNELKSALLREYKKNLTCLSKLFDGVKDLIDFLNEKNIVYITIAGRSNALSGFVAAISEFPTIGCPPFSDKADMLVNIHSTLQMPSQTPVLTVIDPGNCALAVKRIFGV